MFTSRWNRLQTKILFSSLQKTLYGKWARAPSGGTISGRESPGNFSGPKVVLCLPCLHLRSKFQWFWKMIQWNYQFNEEKLTGLWARNCVTINRFWFQNLLSGRNSYGPLERRSREPRKQRESNLGTGTRPWLRITNGELKQMFACLFIFCSQRLLLFSKLIKAHGHPRYINQIDNKKFEIRSD